MGGGVQVRQAGTVYTFQDTKQADAAIKNAMVVRAQAEHRLARFNELVEKLQVARQTLAELEASGRGRIGNAGRRRGGKDG